MKTIPCGPLATPEQLRVFLEHFCACRISSAALAEINRQFGSASATASIPTSTSVSAIAVAVASQPAFRQNPADALAHCGCAYNSDDLSAAVFGEKAFCDLGGGYVLGQPVISEAVKERRYFLAADIEDWLASGQVKGKNREAASIADACEFGHNSPTIQLKMQILIWRPTINGRVAYLTSAGAIRRFCVRGRGACWDLSIRVLLRDVKPST